MRELLVRAGCFVVNVLIGEPAQVVTREQERALALSRANDPYFHAFRARCMLWVYGEDPRREIES